MAADSFVFVLSGDNTAGYDPVIPDLISTPTDLLFLESGETLIFGANFADDLADIQNSNTDGDGERGVYAYVNMSITDHLRTYWEPEWTLDANGVPFTEIIIDSNQDAAPLAPNAPDFLKDSIGVAEGPADNGAPGTQVFGPIVDFSDGSVTLPVTGPVVVEADTWWDIVLEQITMLYQAGWRDFFLDDVSRYFVNGPAGYSIAQGARDMVDLVNAVAAQLDHLDGTNNDTSIAINGGGFIMWDSGLGLNAAEIQAMFGSVDYLVAENLFAASPDLLVQIVRNLEGTNTTLLSIEADTFLPNDIAGAYFELADTMGFLTHVPPNSDYASGPTAGSLPAETYPTPPASPFEIIVASGFGANIQGTTGADMIFGTEGADVIDTMGADDIVYGLGGNDLITSTNSATRIIGGIGDDTINGGTGLDTADYATGFDSISANLDAGIAVAGGLGTDRLNDIENLTAGSGNDRVFGSAAQNRLEGNAGNDLLSGLAGDDMLFGGAGQDSLSGGDDNDMLDGGTEADRLFGNAGADTIMGGAGDDTINGGGDDDVIDSGEGADSAVVGGAGHDDLRGGAGDDGLNGSSGNDRVRGDDGDDRVFGGTGLDTLEGGADNDTLGGAGDNDTLEGGNGEDGLNGGGGNDLMRGGDDADRLFGGTGADTLDGGNGNDLLVGQSGIDTYVFAANWGQDQISSYGNIASGQPRGNEVIDLSALGIGFGDLTIQSSGAHTLVHLTSDVAMANTIEILFRPVSEISVDDFFFG